MSKAASFYIHLRGAARHWLVPMFCKISLVQAFFLLPLQQSPLHKYRRLNRSIWGCLSLVLILLIFPYLFVPIMWWYLECPRSLIVPFPFSAHQHLILSVPLPLSPGWMCAICRLDPNSYQPKRWSFFPSFAFFSE